MRALVIDDEPLVRNLVVTALTDAGYQVIGAADGEEGIAALEKEPCDLVITDILMPQKEGVETIYEIREKKLARWVIAVSGGGLTKNLNFLEIAGKAGADLVLKKPLHVDDLLSAIQSLTASAVPPARRSGEGRGNA